MGLLLAFLLVLEKFRLFLLFTFLLIRKMRLLFLHLNLLINDLLLAWFFTIIMATRVLLLVPTMTAGTWLRHQTD
jgi:hypothetical protein